MARLNKAELVQIAQEMREGLHRANGSAERVVYPYYLGLFNRNGSLRLHVGRTDTWPTIEECQPAVEAFGVADGTDPTGETIRLLSQDGVAVKVKTLRFAWMEA